MRAIIWDLCADLNRDLPRMRRQFFQLKYRGIMQRRTGRFFHFWGLIPRAPNFAEFHARGGGGRLPVMHRDQIPPRGSTLLHGEAKKPTTAVGVALPQGCALAGRRVDLRAAGGGNGLGGWLGGRFFGGGGAFFGRLGERTAAGGGKSGRGWAKKPHTRGLPGFQGSAKVPGSRAKTGTAGSFSGARRAKTGRLRGKTGRSGGRKRRVRRVLGAKKPLFAAKKAGNGAVLGRSWRRKLAGREGLFAQVPSASGGFGGKRRGLRKSLFTRI